MKQAIFIDRDGTFNVLGNYVSKISKFELIPGSDKAVKLARDNGFLIVVITNQAGVARGLHTEDDVQAFHDHIQKVLNEIDTKIDGFYYCPYHPTKGIGKYLKDSENRKPKPGMLLQASKDLDIDLENSFMIGDNISDLLAGENAGCRVVLVRTGYGREHESRLSELKDEAIFVADDLYSAVERIISEFRVNR